MMPFSATGFMQARRLSFIIAASIASGSLLAAQTRPAPATAPPTEQFPDPLPANVSVDQFVLSGDGQRTYYVTKTGEAWLFDHVQKTTARLAAGPLWDLNVSPAGDALAYSKAGARRGETFVWVLALDPATGLARGAERQLSTSSGDVPSIAPDGKLIAFGRDDPSGVGQSLVVAPLAGGPERVVVGGVPSSLASIRWTPDGKAIYFGVNPPVACVPEWSCLPLKQELRQPAGKIRRVSVSGGDAADVTSARGLAPGLSPDGTTLMYLDPAASVSARRWVVANADGTPRRTFTLAPGQTIVGWLRGSTALVTSGGNVRRMRTMPLEGGTSTLLADDADQLLEPSWSPDGSLMMVIGRTTLHAELRLLRAGGSNARTIVLPEIYAYGAAWSPDQQHVAYVGLSDTDLPRVSVVDLTTDKSSPLVDLKADENVSSLRWLPDSRTLVMTETIGRADTGRRVAFRKIDLDGATTMLREIALGPLPSVGMAIDDTTAIVKQNAQDGYHAVRLKGDGPDRDVLPAPPSNASTASLSADGKWLMLQRGPGPGESGATRVIEIVRVDGSDHRTIPVPFQLGVNPKIIPGSTDLIAVEARQANGEAGVYLLSGAQGPRQLFTYSSQNLPPELAISPDGRTLLYLVAENVPPSVRTMDVSGTGRK